MRAMEIVVEQRALHDHTSDARPIDETPEDRIAIVTHLVRTHHGWDTDEARPGLQRVCRITSLK